MSCSNHIPYEQALKNFVTITGKGLIMKQLTDEQIATIYVKWKKTPGSTHADLINAAITKFCKINGLTGEARLPRSYQSGTFTSGHGEGATVHLHFSDADEAERWFDSISEEAQPAESTIWVKRSATSPAECVHCGHYQHIGHAPLCPVLAEQAKGQEAVYQAQYIGDRWTDIDAQEFERLRGSPTIQSRLLYTAPPSQPAREWVGLTEEDRHKYDYLGPDMYEVIMETESKLREKNAGQPAERPEAGVNDVA